MQLTNGVLSVAFNTAGAELTGVFNHLTGINYLWDGQEIWPKHSPVLFPVVGGLKNNSYEYRGNLYQLNRHGFAREKDFEVVEITNSSICFSLKSDAGTREVYPFDFELQILYTLEHNSLTVTYRIFNRGTEEMYFSIGGHPAFHLPLEEGLKYEDYYLLFNNPETADRWPVTNEGLIAATPETFFKGEQKLNLSKDLFMNDALVFKSLKSDQVSLLSNKSSHGLDFKFNGFPYLGIWSAKNADFICIEPWQGLGDSETASGKLEEKEGVLPLSSGGVYTAEWKISVF